MNRTNYLITLALGISLVALLLSAFRQNSTLIEKEYMTIVVAGNEFGSNLKARISVNGEEYTQVNLSTKVLDLKKDYNYNPLLNLLKEYQRAGWQIVQNNLSVLEKSSADEKLVNYFLLEREKPVFKK